MPRFAPNMTKEQKAYLAVGEFMFHFANMEFQLNLALRSLLNLGILESHIVNSNIDVRTKVYIVKAAMNMKPITKADWLKRARKDLEDIVRMAEKRNILAHNTFSPRDDGIDFFYVKAKGSLSLPDEVWSYETFDNFYTDMIRLAGATIELTETLVKHPATALLSAMAESFGNMHPNLRPSIAELLALGTRREEGVAGSDAAVAASDDGVAKE